MGLEVEVVVGLAVGLDGDDVLPAHPADEPFGLGSHGGGGGGVAVGEQSAVGREGEGEHVGLVHGSGFLLPLPLGGGQLMAQPLVHVHGGGDEEEDQQHERDVGCRRGVEQGHAVPVAAEHHGRGRSFL